MKKPSTKHNGNHSSAGIQNAVSPMLPNNEFEPLLDSEQAAALLKIHPKTLQKLARKGEVSAIHIGKLWRFRASALDEWVRKIAS